MSGSLDIKGADLVFALIILLERSMYFVKKKVFKILSINKAVFAPFS
jgi:hypothetical protein